MVEAKRAKMFYRMGEVGKITGLEAHVLRHWEAEFPMLKPKKNRSGHRVFNQSDIDLILRIKSLLQDEGFTVSGARKKLQEKDVAVSEPKPSVPKSKPSSELAEVKAILQNLINMLDRD